MTSKSITLTDFGRDIKTQRKKFPNQKVNNAQKTKSNWKSLKILRKIEGFSESPITKSKDSLFSGNLI